MENDCIRWIQDRISECCSNHSHGIADESFIPARLLDVMEQPPRLVCHPNLPYGTPSIKYAALSYCWGSTADCLTQAKTTTTTLPERMAGLSEVDMTAVLRDAVQITRELSIPYLWIDSLCILQDDPADWEQHCLDMGKVYGSAHVTLCAASSASCHEGFLSQRGLRLRLPFQSQSNPDIISGAYDLQFKHVRALSTPDHQSVLACDLNFCHWAYRAWTFQERALATRMIMFGNSNIHFLCGNSYESRGDGPQPMVKGYHMSLNTKPVDVYQHYRLWDRILSSYSMFNQTSLTRPSDILPALAALARHFQQRLDSDYLCGHWTKNLVRDLMWNHRLRQNLSSRIEHRAHLIAREGLVPSWSRLLQSRRTENIFICGYLMSRSVRVEYRDVTPKVSFASANSFGEVHEAILRLTTWVLNPTSMLMQKENSIAMKEKHCGFQWHSDFQHGQDFSDAETVYRLDLRGRATWSRINPETSAEIAGIGEFKWALLGSMEMWDRSPAPGRDGGGPRQPHRAAFGLVLQAVPGAPGRYWRVGTFIPSINGLHADSLSLFQNLARVETIDII